MSVHRFKMSSVSIMETQVAPTWSGEIDQSRENDSVFFRDKVSGDFQFKMGEYTLIKDAPDCEKIELFLEEKCAGVWVERWRGKFTTYDVKFDENKCLATVSPKTVDGYDCFMGVWDLEQVIASAGAIVICRAFAGTYEAGLSCCTIVAAPTPSLPVCAVPANMCYDETYTSPVTGGQFAYTSCFHRVIGTGTPSVPPSYGSGWTLLSGSDWWRCPAANETSGGVFDQGRWFNDVLEYLADQTACGLTVRSHFLGLNATHAAPPSNIAYTFATDYYQEIQIHQKSDIKRQDATNPAQSFVWRMSFKKLLEDLATMWQVYWKIDGTDLIIEHISYFDAISGIDATTKNFKLEYGKQEGGAPNEERFVWADSTATFNIAHQGYPITYGDCGDGRKERKVNYFSNDVYYIHQVQNAEEIADAGFCLVATQFLNSQYQTFSGNDPLGWVDIHENLHKHNRFFSEGNMNDTPATAFLSVSKTRKLEPFQITVCCDDGFSPEDSINTLAGISEVQKTTVNYFAGGESNIVKIEANL